MKRNSELARSFADIQLFHHNFPQRNEPVHEHPEHQFFIPLEGRFSIDLPQSHPFETCLINPGDLLLIPANTSHSFTSLDVQAGEQLLGLISSKFWQSLSQGKPQLCIARAPQLLKEL